MADNDDILDDLLSWSGPSTGKGLSAPSATATNVRLWGASALLTDKDAGPVAPAPTAVPAGKSRLVLPADLAAMLFPHQSEGVDWLYRKHCNGRACLLADEMGLGKTIQVCAFLGQLYRQKAIKTTVLVVPPTLLPMWERSLLEWGRLDAKLIESVHADSKARRAARWKKLTYGLPCVMLTTYGVLRQDATAIVSCMVDYVVLDEAHLIKDASTRAFKAALMLSARHKIALTGTPLMNSFEDMWSIFRFLDGGILDMKRADFGAVSATLLRGNERDATGQQRAAAESELEQLQAAIQPFMLRREKRDLEVVGSRKHDTVLWVRLSETQRQLYHAFIGTQEAQQAAGPGDGGGGDGEPGEDLTEMVPASEQEDGTGGCSVSPARHNTSNPLLLLTTLSQICNHPWLQLTDQAFREALARPTTDAPCAEVGDIHSGSKLAVSMTVLGRCVAEGRKVLVFSRSKRLLAMLARLLSDDKVRHVRIDGDIASTAERFRAVEAFNADPSVVACLLTTQVGGLGLTFQSASCVLLLDPSWNPSADAQAVDRVHRIGQQHSDVLVFRLVTSGTVEEKVYRNQVFKTMAAKQSLQSAGSQRDQFFRYFTRLQLRSMFEMGDTESSETAAQLEMLHPRRIHTLVRAVTAGVPSLCGVSDNGSVLSEVAASDHEEELSLLAAAAPQQPRERRRRDPASCSPSPPPSQRQRREADEEADIARIVDSLLDSDGSRSAPPEAPGRPSTGPSRSTSQPPPTDAAPAAEAPREACTPPEEAFAAPAGPVVDAVAPELPVAAERPPSAPTAQPQPASRDVSQSHSEARSSASFVECLNVDSD